MPSILWHFIGGSKPATKFKVKGAAPDDPVGKSVVEVWPFLLLLVMFFFIAFSSSTSFLTSATTATESHLIRWLSIVGGFLHMGSIFSCARCRLMCQNHLDAFIN